MNTKTKTMTLDACVDGDVEHLTELVGENYDQFSTFFRIYKQIPTACEKISYTNEKDTISFHVTCDKLNKEELSELNESYKTDGVVIKPTDAGVSVNIPIR